MALADWPPVWPGSLADTSWNKSDRKALPGGTNAGMGTRESTQFTALWTTENIPKIWKEAIMIAIYKEGKDKKKPESYRPVSLLSCLGKNYGKNGEYKNDIEF
ncbi:RNA-directed DNA polymerase from mobile element jockey-like [Elysia marginata]|uniref:RNA-directed DNA polymerase from mobile element jockey-like n=1 Tax=Elysia marginata TaxID=1093978 RepID=A0AAV4FK16_9GAST|nr:RNA-directed DNA polymerase from mobile element jockey-like [Elysia marginata]